MFDAACDILEALLTGTAREEILDEVARPGEFGPALLRLRERMRTNTWKVGGRQVTLDYAVKKYDSEIRQRGFHVLHDWDGKADRVNDDTIPIDVLNYVHAQRGHEPLDRGALAILLEYHFVNVLALLSLCVWEEGDADRNLDRLGLLLKGLQGHGGSGQRFADDIETLILIATSHYELNERGFAPLLDQVRTLNRAHRLKVAMSHAASMGCHLRFGFEVTYARDTVLMRDDNVVDYPWLCFALVSLIREYGDGGDADAKDRIAEAMLNGLTGDARAFIGRRPPGSLSRCEAQRVEFCERFETHRTELLAAFESYRPRPDTYSPLSFFFNFSHNVLKGIVVDALLRRSPWELSFNDLLTELPRDDPRTDAKTVLATTLMGYAQRNPDRIRGQLMPVIVYDALAGRRAFSVTLGKLTE
jgi:hypothetical protein